jgi:hypothetical protein
MRSHARCWRFPRILRGKCISDSEVLQQILRLTADRTELQVTGRHRPGIVGGEYGNVCGGDQATGRMKSANMCEPTHGRLHCPNTKRDADAGHPHVCVVLQVHSVCKLIVCWHPCTVTARRLGGPQQGQMSSRASGKATLEGKYIGTQS